MGQGHVWPQLVRGRLSSGRSKWIRFGYLEILGVHHWRLLWDRREGFSHELKAGPMTRCKGWEELGRSAAGHVPGLVHWLRKPWQGPGQGKSGVLQRHKL